ncbi:hypothetical protein [Lyngbya confervoides]|uniref:hypothetical protein n=1 Tax=Lyngbya confervoides TaxID=207921 RepID=UPI001F3390DD
MRRDFTYIDDIVEAIIQLLPRAPQSNAEGSTACSSPSVPWLYNLGNNQPVRLLDFIEILEKHLGVPAKKEFLPIQPGDVPETYADIENLEADTGYRPTTAIEVGL